MSTGYDLITSCKHCSHTSKTDDTVLLAEKAVINLKTPLLCGEVKTLCILGGICNVIFGKVERARGPEDPDISVVVGATTSRAQVLHETATGPLQVTRVERHGGVDLTN
ncbi:hypothetical protein PoB_001789700 [Plakobranchus ocellatus]|uniref:Uncharacterized protein n=1 Tax=Plakobranchus ocellatus TaxID=259542 RepID=A0AAV3ZA91_9GAST|nr:hypothetical protein PoB_001789700 [Plakobranchus ocellatus]